MHDHREKPKRGADADDACRQREKAENDAIGVLYTSVLSRRRSKDYSASALDDTARLLHMVPEAYTVYNYRRDILQHLWAASNDDAKSIDSDGTTDNVHKRPLTWLQEELGLNSILLLKNYKNYPAFSHRHWIIDTLQSMAQAEHARRDGPPTPDPARSSSAFLVHALNKELAQCDGLLRLDERNFHAWNHRRWVREQLRRACSTDGGDADVAAAAAEQQQKEQEEEGKERAFTTLCIRHSFSNYSAWHQRGVCLQTAIARHAELCLREDFDLLTTAVYCDPNDQAAWFYAPFVIQTWELERGARRREGRGGEEDDIDAFVRATVELIVEEDRLGEADCFLPMYFLLFFLTQRSSTRTFIEAAAKDRCDVGGGGLVDGGTACSEAGRSDAADGGGSAACGEGECHDCVDGAGDPRGGDRRRGRYAAWLYAAMRDRDREGVDCPGSGDVGEDGSNDTRGAAELWMWCVSYLHRRLVRADSLRTGLYDDLISQLTG